MKYLDLKNWERRKHFEFFKEFTDPNFGITTTVNVTKAYQHSLKTGISFFVLYLHACLKAVNTVENFKYRIKDDKVVIHSVIHASATILRPNNTFGFSFIHFDEDFAVFNANFLKEKERIFNSDELFPPINSDDCIFSSALPWVSFTGHKEPLSGFGDTGVPKLAFGKFVEKEGKLEMPVAVSVNHALMDGLHVGIFFDEFRKELNKIS